MTQVRVNLNSIEKVKAFVNTIAQFESEFDLVSGRYVIDAKSIMGIFSLDISKPIDLNIHTETDEALKEILEAIDMYLVK
ncbi:MAG: HPr family phosphocarrier protein [Lachnospiraceae bacterium]|nr:HPr family phosphocarrier protein [Lachnospiraceae bacterium]